MYRRGSVTSTGSQGNEYTLQDIEVALGEHPGQLSGVPPPPQHQQQQQHSAAAIAAASRPDLVVGHDELAAFVNQDAQRMERIKRR